MDLEIRRDEPLALYTTFELGGRARAFVRVENEDDLRAALGFAQSEKLATLMLGGGSNLVVADEGFDGLVVHLAMRGISFAEETTNVVHVTAAAGEPWDSFVGLTVAGELAGLECLSGIPGSVGATPIQNVGAYGQEVSGSVVSVRALDTVGGVIHDIPARQCEFRYRDSWFKDCGEGGGGKHVVLAVKFALRRGGAPLVKYAELERAVRARGEGVPSLSDVRELVLELRRSKSMVLSEHDENRRSAGSFFTNPIVSQGLADDVEERARSLGVLADGEKMPRFSADPAVKLAAGWLIERAGFAKGMRRGPVGISSRHALALVHHGGGSTRELLALAVEIVDGVRAKFGVTLRPEPVIVGYPDGHPLL